MNDEPRKDLATRAFQMRVLDEFAAVRREQAAFRDEAGVQLSALREQTSIMREDITRIPAQQSAMVQDLTRFDERLTSLEEPSMSVCKRIDQSGKRYRCRFRDWEKSWRPS